MFMCGMSEIKITPPLGLSMPGYFTDRKSLGTRDNLYAKAFVVENDGEAVAMIILDALSVRQTEVKKIRDRIAGYTGIRDTSILVAATHSHTAGPVGDIIESKVDVEYVEFMVKCASEAAIKAYNERRPAKISFGRGVASHIAFNRRYWMKDGSVRTNPVAGYDEILRPAGPVDEEVAVLKVDDLEDRTIGIIVNFGCHLDTVGGNEISADYPSELSQIMKDRLGKHAVILFMTGCCGDINHCDFRGTDTSWDMPDYYKIIGRKIADVVSAVLKGMRPLNPYDIMCKNESVILAMRKPSEEALSHARKVLEDSIHDECGEPGMARELLKYSQNIEKSRNVEIQVFKIGDLFIIGWPGEMFVEFGIELKAILRDKFLMISELSNCDAGYIPTEEAFEQGGYETSLSFDSNLEKAAGRLIMEKTLSLLDT